jgi:ABC-2 type transport system permease protein
VVLEVPGPVPGPSDVNQVEQENGSSPDLTFGSPWPDGNSTAKVTRTVSANVGLGQRVADVWRSRELLANLVRTEIKVKYKNSVLGIMWSMLAPAMTLIIFTIVFGVLLKNGIPFFVIFLFSGLLLWNFFQTAVQAGTGTIVNNSGLVKKVSFPREILALASVGTASVFFFFQAIVMVIFLFIFQRSPDWPLLPLVLLALVAGAVWAAALAVFLSAVNVYLRDTQHLVEVLLTAWFWACPIVYCYWITVAKSAKLHAWHITWLYFLNPLVPLVLTFQRVLYNIPVGHLTRQPYTLTRFLPPWPGSTYLWADLGVLAVGLVLFVLALVVFGRLEGNFAEEL